MTSPSRNFVLFVCSLLLTICQGARADDEARCAAAAGAFVEGHVVVAPRFVRGHYYKGVHLSHTQLTLRRDSDGADFIVAMDNVFASGYDPHARYVPAPLDTIRVGDTIEVCGRSFPGGMHWVHTNCGDRPTARDPDGWVRIVGADGRAGDNLENATRYCALWPRR